jgi:hypothetical protein
MIVSHIFAKVETEVLDPIPLTDLYQYVVGANGIFIRASRPDLDVMIWVASTREPVRGLRLLAPHVYLGAGKVPARQTARMVEMAYHAQAREILFYLQVEPWKNYEAEPAWMARPPHPWVLTLPSQIATSASVRPSDPFGAPDALIEVHSHYSMEPFFSNMDDRDEQGFRIYAVLGNLLSQPMLHVRIGVYGHFYKIPAGWVFELPVGLKDAYLSGREYGL